VSLTRIQRTFVRLVKVRHIGWMHSPLFPKKHRKSKVIKYVRVEIIDAITGEKTTALSFEDSKIRLKKWLKLRNLRAHFADMVIKPGSTWQKLSKEQLQNYPILVKVNDAKFPYLIDHASDKITIKKRTTCSIFLKIVENIDYLKIINDKKKLLGQ